MHKFTIRQRGIRKGGSGTKTNNKGLKIYIHVTVNISWSVGELGIRQTKNRWLWISGDARCGVCTHLRRFNYPNPLLEIRHADPCRAIRGNSISVDSTLPPLNKASARHERHDVCMCIYIYICMRIYTYMYVCMYVCTYVRTYVCIYACIYTQLYDYIYKQLTSSVCMYIYIYIYIYMYVYTPCCCHFSHSVAIIPPTDWTHAYARTRAQIILLMNSINSNSNSNSNSHSTHTAWYTPPISRSSVWYSNRFSDRRSKKRRGSSIFEAEDRRLQVSSKIEDGSEAPRCSQGGALGDGRCGDPCPTPLWLEIAKQINIPGPL